MKSRARKQPNRRVTISISRAELCMVVVESSGERRSIRGQRVTWLEEAASLSSKEGLAELSGALTELATAEKLNGATVTVALSSDFCVTRVLAGEAERMRGELRALRERSSQYLLLGAGRKAVAESNRPIDAKQTQAWMTVTNKVILDHVVQALAQAGLQAGLIEHDMVSICRAVGRMGRDADSPVIVVGLNHRGVDLGICYKGQLLFDYRPGGLDCKGRIAEIVQQHLERIQRYCTRQFRFAKGEIKQVLLYGAADEVAAIQQQFDRGADGLRSEVLTPRAACPDWEHDTALGNDAGYFAAVGAALVDDPQLASGQGMAVPNLMDYFHSANRAPLWPTLVRTGWPVAATLLLAVGVLGAAVWKNRQAATLERSLAQFDTQQGLLRNMTLETEAATTQLNYLTRIQGRLMNPAWHRVLTMIGQCMPELVWLDSLRVEQDGTMSITGPARSEDLVFEFVRHLKRVPVLENVNLEGQQPIRLPEPLGQVIKFDIKCKFNDQGSPVERTASSG